MSKVYQLFSLILILFATQLGMAQNYRAVLSGNHEPFPVLSQALGTVDATLSGDTLALSGDFAGIVSGVDTTIAGGAHVHRGLAGQNGDVELVMNPTLSEGLSSGMFEVATNTFVLDDELQSALSQRRLYINVHSRDHSGGEIRGQILPEADEVYSANLFGSNQTTSVMSNGYGSILLERTGNTVVVTGSFQLTSPLATEINGGIHIHQAPAGSNGDVLQPLTVTLTNGGFSGEIRAEDNTYDFSDEEIANLMAEGWYINVHSDQWPGGELRGQLTPLATAKFRTHLSGMNQTPPVISFATGKLALALRDGNLTVSGSLSGLESDLNVDIAGGAHIHLEMAGRNGNVVFPLQVTPGDDATSGTFEPEQNTFPISADSITALMGRSLYVNIHTLNNAGGEIRGQILPESNYFFNAYLSGSQQPDPVLTNAEGAVVLEVLGDSVTVSGTYSNLSSALAVNIANGAHIHFAPVGSNGDVAYPLVPTPGNDNFNGRWRAVDNGFAAAFARRDSIRARLAYVNVHTDNFNGGEIRGQLMHESVANFYTPLSGAEQTPAVLSQAAGAAMLEYNGSNAVVVGSFSGLGSDLNAAARGGSHLHVGLPGSNGSIITELAVIQGDDMTAGTYDAMNNMYEVSPGYMDTVRQRMLYVNVHSLDNGGGEIRGQLRPLARNYHLANLRGKNETTPVASTGMGAVILEQNATSVTAYGSFSGLVGDFATEVAGGAHIHGAMAGMNAGILQGLNSEVGADLKSAVFLADSNAYELADSAMMMLVMGNTYVNIHSTEVMSGEIRGQLLHEINAAPPSPLFSEPASGDTITIEEDGLDTEFAARWDAVEDPDENKVVYIWQVSDTADFSNPGLSVNTGTATEFVITLGAIDTLLATLGFDSGAVTLYHRVVALDGSLCSPATVDSIVVVKGTSTSIKENPYLSENFRIFPNPVTDVLQLEMDLKLGAQGVIQVVDMAGKVVKEQDVWLFEGINRVVHPVSDLQSGVYTARLMLGGELAVSQLFVKQ